MSDLYFNVLWYIRFYQRCAYEAWRDLTPMGYGMILISVALFGWFLMKGSLKR